VPHHVVFYANWIFWLYAFLFVPYALFVGFYAARTRDWRHTPEGRALMILAGAIVAVLTFAMVAQVTAIPPLARDALRLVTLTAVAAAGWYLFLNLLRRQRERRKDCP
jgi:hypothetical protein